MKIVSWPSTAEINFKAVLIHTSKVLAAEYITFNKCLYPCLAKVYNACLTHCQVTWSTRVEKWKCQFGEVNSICLLGMDPQFIFISFMHRIILLML